MVEQAAKRIDPFGLGAARGLPDRLLLVTVAAMTFLAALAVSGALASSGLAASWRNDTQAALTVQVTVPDAPAAGGTRLQAVSRLLASAPGVTGLRQLTTGQVNALLRPWLGADAGSLGLNLPAVITGTWSGATLAPLRARLASAAPGTLVDNGESWAARVATLTASIEACAAAVLVIVAGVAIAVIAIATRAGLAQRRETIEIIHGLGALDAEIAARFASRATAFTAAGALAGAAIALPVLFWLASLAAPFAGGGAASGGFPPGIWAALPMLPFCAALIGWVTTQLTVHRWLRGLP